MTLTMGSLFDGIGGFPLAASHVGIKTIWASEIEPFPIKVTMERFPEMVHVGDITKLKGEDLPPVDIVCGGFPCQDTSNANVARQGLAGARSGLFFQMIRLIKELRDADKKRGRTGQSVRPRWSVFENVPGLFTSNQGEDFQIVLQETTRVSCDSVFIPRPDSGKWQPAGRILLGDTFSLAWKCLDAQYWPGTPQRRRRVYIITDFAGGSAPKILFDEAGLFGNPPQVEGAWKTPASTAGAGAEDTGWADTT